MIRDVRTHRVSVPLHTPFVTALRSTTTVDTVAVSITDGEHTGWGEAPQVWQVTGESLAGAEACLDGPLRAVVEGADPDDLRPLLRRVRRAVAANHGAKAALDVALHDLVARRRGVPLHVLLGGTRTSVPTDVTLSVAAPADLAPTAVRRVADGFRTLKLKVGSDARGDVDRVRAVRDAIGPDVALRLDANQGWSRREALTAITAMEDADLGVELVEQPVVAADLDGLAHVTARVSTPVMADEAVYGVRDLVAVIRGGAADLVNVKLAKSGGLDVATTLLDLAAEHGVGSTVGSMMETHLGIGAAAALVAAYDTDVVPDLDAAWWSVASPWIGGIDYEGATVRLPSAPGLGIDGLA